jgi:hypothetical protein
MKPPRRILVLVLTAAMGLGIWGLAFTYTPAAFSDGDVLSAAALNALLNDNFQAASEAVVGKVGRAGDTMTGPLGIATATSGGVSTFSVENTGTSGYAALFQNTAANTAPTVGIKNLGTGPGLWVLSDNGGNFFEGHTGSLSPAIAIKANGSIENAVRSGLPLAYGRVAAAGTRVDGASTSNWTVTTDTDSGGLRYRISIAGVSINASQYSVTLGVGASSPRFATYSSVSGDLLVYLHDAAGNRVSDAPFSFAVFRPGF